MQKIFLLFLLLAAPFLNRAQGVKTITFKKERLKTQVKHYYITGVKDDRQDTTNIGSVRSGLFSKKTVALNLPNGAAAALDNFLKNNLTEDSRNVPVVLHISQLEVAEKTGGLKAESEVRMNVAFYNASGMIAEYKVNNTVQASMDATRYIEELIRMGLDNMLEQFDTWAGQHQQQLKASTAGPTVEVEVEISANEDDTDKIAWSRLRPLTLADFLGKPDNLSRATAATNSGLDVHTSQQSQFGQTKVKVSITPFFDRTRSWCRLNSRDERTLAHEQLHFNITAIKACELAAAIRSFTFTPDNYMKELEQLYRQKDKETQQQQELYDGQTNHGQIAAAQAKWEELVREALGKQPCFK